MTTYKIEIQDDLLQVGFNPDRPANGDRIVRDAAALLDEMVATGMLRGGPLLKIDGPASILVSYAIAHKVCHLYGAIAVHDPKIGRKGYKTYVTVITHNPAYQVGELIEIEAQDVPVNPQIVKVVLCGPPHSGKSCLREGLKTAILGIPNAPYPYVITACPDGEGAHFAQTHQRDDKYAREIKKSYQAPFTADFAQVRAGWVKDACNYLNIIDIGGKISQENRAIVEHATHAIILAGDPSEIPHWQKFCESVGLSVIAVIHSDYEAKSDRIDSQIPLLTGSVHHLSRGEDVSCRPMVQALAQLLVRLVNFGGELE